MPNPEVIKKVTHTFCHLETPSNLLQSKEHLRTVPLFYIPKPIPTHAEKSISKKQMSKKGQIREIVWFLNQP